MKQLDFGQQFFFQRQSEREQCAHGPHEEQVGRFFVMSLLGALGVHKFYEGKVGMGILYLFTVGLFGIGWVIDCIALLFKPNPYFV